MPTDTSEPAGFATVALLLERLLGEVKGLREAVEASQRASAGAVAGAPEALWTAAEVAGYLRCSRSKVYQAAEARTLPSLHVGGQLRFEPERIRAWARNPTVSPGRLLPIRRPEGQGA
jgi:excisionase family DNA binding protein